MSLTERYTQETGETPFDHTGGYTYAFTRWVMKVAETAIESLQYNQKLMVGELL